MERRRGGDREGSALKTALVVIGGLALSWLTMETAFKPYLDRIRGVIDRSDPNHDPDSDKNDDTAEKTLEDQGNDKGSD